MERTRSLLTMVTALLVLGTTSGVAQTIPSPYRFVDSRHTVSAFGGYIDTDPGALDLGPRSGPVAGLRYSFRISGPFTIEGKASYLPLSREVIDTTLVDGAPDRLGEADLSLALLEAALRFNITGPRTFYNLMPYIVVGGGGAIELSGDSELDEQLEPGVPYEFGTTFAGTIGAGIEWFVTRRLGLRADFRDTLWKLEAPPAFVTTGEELDVPSEEWVQNFSFLLGLAYHF